MLRLALLVYSMRWRGRSGYGEITLVYSLFIIRESRMMRDQATRHRRRV